MDYLDPKKKRAHRNRLVAGYGLFAVLIAFATLVLVFVANGFFIDSKGELIQNGLVFVDSKPGGAEVYLNGEKQNRATDTRLVVPGGATYDVELRREGYRDWLRNIRLDGGSLRQLTYPILIPNELVQTSQTTLRADPVSVLQSPDRDRVLFSYADDPFTLQILDISQGIPTITAIALGSSLVDAQNPGSITFVEWSSDNRRVLATYTTGATTEYLLVDVRAPTASVNLTRTLSGGLPFSYSLRDGKSDKYYAFNTETKLLYRANDTAIADTPVIVAPLIGFDTTRDDWILYAVKNSQGIHEIRFARTEDNVDILIRDGLAETDAYLLSLHAFKNAPVLAFSSPSENRAIVYADPEAYLRSNEEASVPLATTVLRVMSPTQILFSSTGGTVFIAGETFASHEFRADRSHRFSLNTPRDMASPVRLVDDSHFTYTAADGLQVFSDFDGSNQYDLFTVHKNIIFFPANLQNIFTVRAGAAATETVQAQPPQIINTSLIVE